MSISLPFLKRGARSSGAGSSKRPPLELLVHANGRKALACGVQWRTVATSGGRDDAVKLARAAGATHYVFRGQQVGMGSMPNSTDASLLVFPAAVVAGRQHVGTAISALRVAPGEYWIAATKDGSPTSADMFLIDLDDAAALERVRDLQQQFGGPDQVSVYTNIEHHGIEGAKSLSPEDMLDYPLGEADVLKPLPRSGATIPKPVLGFVALAALVLLGQKGWQMYEQARLARLAASTQAAEIDPAQAWAQAISTWEAGVAAPAPDALAAVRVALNQLPLEWDGWRMGQAACNAGPVNAAASPSARAWNCKASYTRTKTGSFNRDMGRSLPAGWSVHFTPLNGMDLTWSVQQTADTIKVGALRKSEFFVIEMASRLQRLMPALAGDVPFAFVPVEIPAPRKADGTALPPDPQAQGIRQAVISVKAPLRSIDALIAANVEADWTSLTVVYDAQEPKGGIKSSALMAEARGTMYARN